MHTAQGVSGMNGSIQERVGVCFVASALAALPLPAAGLCALCLGVVRRAATVELTRCPTVRRPPTSRSRQTRPSSAVKCRATRRWPRCSSAQGLAGDAVQRVVEAAQTVFDPRRLRSAQPFSLERTLEGALRFFEYEIDPDWFLRVIPGSTGTPEVRAELVPIPKTLEHGHGVGHDRRRHAVAVPGHGRGR